MKKTFWNHFRNHMMIAGIIGIIAFAFPVYPTVAQTSDQETVEENQPPPFPAGKREERKHRRPPHHPGVVLMQVLDTDRDLELSASEIENAPNALKTLDKNGDGRLGCGELRPGLMRKHSRNSGVQGTSDNTSSSGNSAETN